MANVQLGCSSQSSSERSYSNGETPTSCVVHQAMTKGCYTCRRRRIVCDNGLPTCRKCRDAGKECLGYQKPLVWVKGGIASRGKMMGLSFDDVADQDYPTSAHGRGCSIVGAGQTAGPARSSTAQASPFADRDEMVWAEDDDYQNWAETRSDSPVVRYNGDGEIVHVRRPSADSLPPALIDPLFKNVPNLSRFYICHFNQRLARDLALYDAVKNPYRDLIPFIGESPLLTDSLAAVGAIHFAYISTNERQLPKSSEGGNIKAFESFLSDQNQAQGSSLALSPWVKSKAYEHFLRLKQRALRRLSADVSNPLTRNDDRTVAAIFVLILLDAMESGNGAWKYHLEGAKNLLKSRQSSSHDQSMRGMIDGLDTFVVDSCLITEIMGSTLARPGVLSKPYYSQSMGPAILKRLEKTAWVGCPAYLLEVMFFVHAQRYSDADLTPEYSLSFLSPSESGHPDSPLAVLQHIEAFDAFAWAEEMQTFLFLPDLSKRLALASAYKAGVYLYAKRVLSKVGPLAPDPVSSNSSYVRDHDSVESELIQNLSLITPEDEHFKCTIWLTFIAGAESKYPEQRMFTLERLSALWSAIISVNVQNAAWVLRLMWQRQDEKRQDCERRRTEMGTNTSDDALTTDADEEFDWIQELDLSRTDWLFI